jgi:hypothetical protein
MKTHAQKPNVIRARVLALAVNHDEVQRYALAGGEKIASPDAKLADLFVMAGMLASAFRDPGWQRNHLRQLYGFTTGWLMSLGVNTPVVLINAERDRQQKLFLAGEFHFTCSSPTASAPRKFRILAEELGEVANALDRLEARHSSLNARHLIEELVQVAAVAVAWLEALESK